MEQALVPTEKKRRQAKSKTGQTTTKNLEKRLTQSYCNNIVPLLDQSWTELRKMVTGKEIAAKDRARAIELIFQAARIVKSKDTIVQVNTQVNNKTEVNNTSGVRSMEAILRRLEARDVATGVSEVIEAEVV